MRTTMTASTTAISKPFSLELISVSSARRPLARVRAWSRRARDRRRHGRRLALRRPALALLYQLVEGQVEQIVAALGIDQHLRRRREDLLERLEIDALARDRGRLLILRNDAAEAIRLAFRVRDHLLAVRLGLLSLTRSGAARTRQDPIAVLLRAQDSPLAILARLDGILHGVLDLAREVRLLQVHLEH